MREKNNIEKLLNKSSKSLQEYIDNDTPESSFIEDFEPGAFYNEGGQQYEVYFSQKPCYGAEKIGNITILRDCENKELIAGIIVEQEKIT